MPRFEQDRILCPVLCLSELHSQSEGKSGLQRSASPVCVEQIVWVLFFGITSNLRASDAGFIASVLSASVLSSRIGWSWTGPGQRLLWERSR